MKARVLKKLLNNIGYTVNNNKEYIAVGSPYCHDLYSINKKTLHLKYALDTFNEGRKCILKKDEEMLFVWDKLQELIDNGQIRDIIDGKDEIENPLTVYTVDDGELIETFTDAYGYPNTTIDGYIMYDNTYFKTKKEAIEYGLREYKSGFETCTETWQEAIKKVDEIKNRTEMYAKRIEHLKSLQKQLQ